MQKIAQNRPREQETGVLRTLAEGQAGAARFYNSVTLYMCFVCYDKGEEAKTVWRIFCLSKTTLPFGGS